MINIIYKYIYILINSFCAGGVGHLRNNKELILQFYIILTTLLSRIIFK